jgi:hypothetical protein
LVKIFEEVVDSYQVLLEDLEKNIPKLTPTWKNPTDSTMSRISLLEMYNGFTGLLLQKSDAWWNIVNSINTKYIPCVYEIPELPSMPIIYPTISPTQAILEEKQRIEAEHQSQLLAQRERDKEQEGNEEDEVMEDIDKGQDGNDEDEDMEDMDQGQDGEGSEDGKKRQSGEDDSEDGDKGESGEDNGGDSDNDRVMKDCGTGEQTPLEKKLLLLKDMLLCRE